MDLESILKDSAKYHLKSKSSKKKSMLQMWLPNTHLLHNKNSKSNRCKKNAQNLLTLQMLRKWKLHNQWRQLGSRLTEWHTDSKSNILKEMHYKIINICDTSESCVIYEDDTYDILWRTAKALLVGAMFDLNLGICQEHMLYLSCLIWQIEV